MAGGSTLGLALMLALALGLASTATAQQSYNNLRPDTLFHMDYRESVSTPSWARDTVSPTFRISAWNQCPAGTHYVLRSKASPVGQNPDFPRDFVLGCCPVDFTGCTVPGNDRVIGCCPQGQQCAYRTGARAYGGGLRFLACIDEPSQDCHNVRCPAGYLCCPHQNLRKSVCVPHDGDPNDYEAMCGEPHTAAPALIVPSRRVRDYVYYEFPPRLRNTTKMTVQGVANVSVALSASPPQFVCPHTYKRCHIGDLCSVSQFTPAGSNITLTKLSHCCPPNHTTCHGLRSETSGDLPPTDPGGFIGCADDLAGEQCCGDSICPPGHKCCVSTDPFSGNVVDKQCCPNELECCYGDPGHGSIGLPLIDGLLRLPRSYCGMTVFNNSCAMDRWAPSQNFIMDRTLRNGPFPELDP